MVVNAAGRPVAALDPERQYHDRGSLADASAPAARRSGKLAHPIDALSDAAAPPRQVPMAAIPRGLAHDLDCGPRRRKRGNSARHGL